MCVKDLELYVCNRLKQERERLGLSQLELAYESNVSQNMITYIETNKRTPSLNTVLKLCKAMKINPRVLFPDDSLNKKADAKRMVLELVQKFM